MVCGNGWLKLFSLSPRWRHDSCARRCRGWPRSQSPAPSGNARCGDVAIDVPPIERAGSDAHAEGMVMSYSNLQKLFSTSSVLLHRRRVKHHNYYFCT